MGISLTVLYLLAAIMHLTAGASSGLVSVSDELDPFSTEETVRLDDSKNVVHQLIQALELKASLLKTTDRKGLTPLEKTEALLKAMIDDFYQLTEVLNSENAYSFLKTKGIERVIVPNLSIQHKELRTQVLNLLKTLFKIAPATTIEIIPSDIAVTLLDIFEDDHVAIKAHVLDILHAWLPNNPKVQDHIMKMTGLEPFYRQISDLDATVISTLLDLFSKILSEHIDAVNEDSQKTKADLKKVKLYSRIGLLDVVSAPKVCDGLVNIFQNMWLASLDRNDMMVLVLDIVKKTKPLCLPNFRQKAKALKLFGEFLNSIRRMNTDEKDFGLNVSEMEAMLEDYVEKLKNVARDEF